MLLSVFEMFLTRSKYVLNDLCDRLITNDVMFRELLYTCMITLTLLLFCKQHIAKVYYNLEVYLTIIENDIIHQFALIRI